MAVFSVAVSSRHPLILFVTRGVLIPLPARLLPMVAQTNKGFDGSIKALHRTGLSRWVWPWGFWFAHVRTPVAQLDRSLRREVASATAERGLFLTQPCLSRQVFYGSRRLAGGASHDQGSEASQTM